MQRRRVRVDIKFERSQKSKALYMSDHEGSHWVAMELRLVSVACSAALHASRKSVKAVVASDLSKATL
jgi:acetolactate synthase regulatory subunit